MELLAGIGLVNILITIAVLVIVLLIHRTKPKSYAWKQPTLNLNNFDPKSKPANMNNEKRSPKIVSESMAYRIEHDE